MRIIRFLSREDREWRKPPVYLKAGDVVSVVVEKIGALTNAVT